MARNRKNQAAEIRFGPVLKVVLLCSLICGSALGYVWQKSQIARLGSDISRREKALKELKDDNKVRADQIAFLRSPVMLDHRARELNLGLAPAQPMQVVRLVEVPPARPKDGPPQLAQRPAFGGTP